MQKVQELRGWWKQRESRIKKVSFRIVLNILIYTLMIGLSFVFIYPFLYMIVTSFKTPADLADISVTWLLNDVRLENYVTGFKTLNYGSRLFNTLFVVIVSVIGHVISCSFIGYGFARYKFKGKAIWFALLVLGIIIPSETIIVPLYILFGKIGFLGSYLPIIVPAFLGFGLRGGLFVFIFRQFFLSLPPALEEAAAIDGAGPIRTFFSVAFPNARSSSLICIVLGCVWHWNDTFEPSMYLDQQEQYLLPQMLPHLIGMIGNDSTLALLFDPNAEIYNEAVAMAATTLVVLPLIIFYLMVQNKFMASVERSGITG